MTHNGEAKGMYVDLFGEGRRVEKPLYQWDRDCPGFGIRLNRDGKRLFVAKMSVNGRPKWFTIGPVDVLKLIEVRQLVQRMKLVARTGQDPSDLVKSFIYSSGVDSNAGITFGEFFDIYIEGYAKVYKRSWLKDSQRVKLYVLPLWRERRLSSLTRVDFLKIFTAISKTRKTAANRLKETITTIFKQAIIMGYLDAGHPNPTFGIRKHRETKRRIKLELSDMPKLSTALNSYPQRQYAQAITLILMLGIRHGECLRLRWDWFDLENKVLTFPNSETKNSEGHVLPLSPSVLRLLKDIRRFRDVPYVFPCKLTGKPITRLTVAWHKIRMQIGRPNLTIHDLRRSAGCFILAQTGDITMVRDVLNHTDQHVTAVYGFYDVKGIKSALDNHSALMEQSLGLDPQREA